MSTPNYDTPSGINAGARNSDSTVFIDTDGITAEKTDCPKPPKSDSIGCENKIADLSKYGAVFTLKYFKLYFTGKLKSG